MHFTIQRSQLVKMLESVRRPLPGVKEPDKGVRIYACGARVFIESNGKTAGEEALVFRDAAAPSR